MTVEVRIYSRFDVDLLALCAARYPVKKMMRSALSAYANGKPLTFYIDEPQSFSLQGTKTARFRMAIPANDKATISLLENIKPGFRNNFCKQILRNALDPLNLTIYFKDERFYEQYKANAKSHDLESRENVVLLSSVEKTYEAPIFAGKAKKEGAKAEDGSQSPPADSVSSIISEIVAPQVREEILANGSEAEPGDSKAEEKVEQPEESPAEPSRTPALDNVDSDAMMALFDGLV